MPPKKKTQAKSADEDGSEEETTTTRRSGRVAAAKDKAKEEEEEKAAKGRGRSASAKGGKKKADNSPDDETQTKKAAKKVKKGSKKDMDEEDDDEEEEEEENGKSSKKEAVKMVKAVTKGGVAVDQYCHMKNSTHVYVDTSGKVYAATLNQSNLKTNANKFYVCQVLQSDTDNSKFWVFFRWGRIGYEGQQSTSGPYKSAQPAIAEYEGKIYDKTRKGDYIKLDIAYDNDDKNGDDDEDEKPKAKAKSVPKKASKSKDDDEDEEDDDDKEEKKADKKEEKEPVKMVKAVTKGGVAVDPLCRMKDKVHVYTGAPGNKVYAATLNQSDIKNNNNKFYIVQLLQSDANKDEFWVFNRWGRVGADGQQATKGPFKNIQAAVSEYESKIYDKTKKGDYIELAISYDNDNTEEAQERLNTDSADSKLPTQVKDLVQLIFDLKLMNNAMKEIGYDAKKMPLGKLAKTTIKAGYDVLQRISTAIQNKASRSKLEDLSSEFFSLIPHDIGFQKMNTLTLDTDKKVKDKLEMLQSLEEMQIATKILEEAKDSGNLIDSNYAKLKCDIKPLPKEDKTYKLLCDYVKNGHGHTHKAWNLEVVQIFEIDKEEDRLRFKKDIGNRMLLWHGSRLTNFVGIISQGLRIAPPEAPVTGYMFGKGVYFADMVSKSAQYCFTSRENNTGLMLLCEVALGEMNELYYADYYADKLLEGTNKKSTKGMGKNAPPASSFVTMDDGTIIPIGKGEDTKIAQGSLLYNEFIVYDIAQIRLRYLLRIKFNYT
mmetsp:Transcript_64488/g.74962  ORF Transcript_64488/g.74962 Transcript_64488/m.74962 type:complete len:768 (+) Transcript_64488:42-2345(+)